jgi:hypothetical protein
MRKQILTILTLGAMSLANDLPICEEYAGEENISCVAGERHAVIISYHKDGSRTYEYFKDNRKIYLEYGENYVYASDGRRTLDLDHIPNENKTAYIDELFFGLIESLDF